MPNENEPRAPHDPLDSVLGECARSIPLLLPSLSGVIRDREDDFLRLGTTVFGINSQAKAFSSTATEMASSMGEGALHAAIAELESHTAEARSVFSSTSSAEQLQGMSEVLRLVRGLDLAMSRFTALVRTLKVLEITTRIESARLGAAGTGFTTLADDVRALGNVVDEHTARIGEHSVLLMNQVSTALERNRTRISAQERVVEGMFASLFEGISDLERMRADSTALVADLAKGSRQVAEGMGHVIASVQFHDITRQQVEHVEEILVQAENEIRALPEGADRSGLAAWVRDVLRLQAPLLRQAEDMFRRAVEDFISNLEAIADNTRVLGDRIAAVAYDDKGGPSILDTIRRHIARVMEAMRTTSAHVAETSRTMSGMAETIATVSFFVHGIEDIGAEIELIALNARVKAAHTGDMGRTLGVIAMEIQNLSVEARTRTGEVAGILNRISDLAHRLSDLARSSDVSELIDGMQGRFEKVLDRLAGLDLELAGKIEHLSGMGVELVTRIHALTTSIHFHEPVSCQLNELEKTMRRLEAGFDPFRDGLDAARQPEKLREQLSRYTMDSERLVHLAVMGRHPGDGEDVVFGEEDVELFGDGGIELFDEPGDGCGKTGPEDDLGDNVELF